MSNFCFSSAGSLVIIQKASLAGDTGILSQQRRNSPERNACKWTARFELPPSDVFGAARLPAVRAAFWQPVPSSRTGAVEWHAAWAAAAAIGIPSQQRRACALIGALAAVCWEFGSRCSSPTAHIVAATCRQLLPMARAELVMHTALQYCQSSRKLRPLSCRPFRRTQSWGTLIFHHRRRHTKTLTSEALRDVAEPSCAPRPSCDIYM